MTDDVQKFDDAKLKSAIRQIKGVEAARPELVERVRAALAKEGASENSAQRSGQRLTLGRPAKAPMHPLRKFITALAAILVLGIGGAKIYLAWHEEATRTNDFYGHESLLAAMVQVHDSGAAGKADFKPLSAPLTDPAALAKEAGAKLGRPVPDVDLSKQGWTLDAAALCSIEGSAAVRFHYTGHGKNITLISLPTSALGAIQAPNYEQMSGSNPISGYVDGKSLNCVVGDPSMSMPDVTALRETEKG